MANNETDRTLEEVAARLQNAKAAIPAAKELIEVLREAHEDTSTVEAMLLEAETRIRNWERVLQRRGVTLSDTGSATKGG